MLHSRPRLSPDARLEQHLHQEDGKWRPVQMKLSLTRGIPSSLRVEPAVADFLARLDGGHSLGELAAALAGAVSADPARVTKECVEIVRRLVERRLLLI